MLYLEDYVEMIEHLPQEVREHLTEMREFELEVQNAMDHLNVRIKNFFATGKKSKPEQREEEEKGIIAEYNRALECSDEKVNITVRIMEQMQKHMRKLDVELNKFKLELEADTPGITSILEQHSLELDKASSVTTAPQNHQRSRHQVAGPRGAPMLDMPSGSLPMGGMIAPGQDGVSYPGLMVNAQGMATPISPATMMPNSFQYSAPSHMPFPSRPVGPYDATSPYAPVPSAIPPVSPHLHPAAVGLSHAAAVNGSRRSSLSNASTVVTSGTVRIPVAGGDDNQDPLTMAVAQSYRTKKNHKRKGHKSTSSTSYAAPAVGAPSVQSQETSLPNSENVAAAASSTTAATAGAAAAGAAAATVAVGSSAEAGGDKDWTAEGNESEQRYCLCNQISYGDMVACDNASCPIEWFHYGCVGVTETPTGKWYCPQCAPLMKPRKKHHR